MQGSPTRERPPDWRWTRQRNAVLRMLHGSPEFVSARELHAALTAEGSTVGLTTVYRTLRILERDGHVDVVRDKGGERLYRPQPADGHRHYLVCRHCGLSRPVEAEAVERWAEGVAADTGFSEVEHTVELTGICDQCRSGPDRSAPHP
ncbi:MULTISPECIES: transcriptional repressor [unclassified Streptomyces]|uniref:Fur family transcriptional regulator n=1 Tax=unclassified Streptomyces TaxID=2593676 RepID=UPI002E29CED3|nr:transcriptional repressor [Streptomyces sp. NBC_00228]WSW96415.1 transcriptional repressor [Streptomyces sp. NBC_00989]